MTSLDHLDNIEQGPDLKLLTVVSENDGEDQMNQAFMMEHSAIVMKDYDIDPEEDLSMVKDKLSLLDVKDFNITDEIRRVDGPLGRRTMVKARLSQPPKF